MLSEKTKDRIKKLQALAERGVGGEKETAKVKLEKLLEDNGIHSIEDLEEAYKRLEAVGHKEADIERWEKVEKILRKHDILGWRWYKEDSWVEDLEKALNSSYPKELELTLDALKREVNRLEKLKEECNADGKSGVSGDQ